MLVLFNSANQPKQRKVYETGHKMALDEIVSDRDEWLAKELGLKLEPKRVPVDTVVIDHVEAPGEN